MSKVYRSAPPSEYMAVICNSGKTHILETVTSDYHVEVRSMAEKSAERLMLSGDIDSGASISIYRNNECFEAYYWPQIRENSNVSD